MTIYNYIELLFIILFFIEVGNKQSEARRLRFLYFETAIVLFVLAFRNYNVGADSILYTSYYSNPSTYLHQMPVGFELFCNFLKLFSRQWQFFIFVTSIISIVPFFYYVKKESAVVSLSFLTFLMCWELLWLLETPIKQTTAITFFWIGLMVLKNASCGHKYIRWIIGLVFIAFSILTHSSLVMIMGVLVLLHFVNYSKKSAIFSIVISVIVSSSIIPLIPGLYDRLVTYTTAYQLFDNVQNYTEDIATGLITYDIKKYLLPSVFVILLVLLCSEDELKSFQAKCLVTGTVIFDLFVAFPNIPRVVLFFTLIGSSLCPRRYRSLLFGGKQSILCWAHILILFAFYYIHFTKCVYFKPTMDADILPYSFWF